MFPFSLILPREPKNTNTHTYSFSHMIISFWSKINSMSSGTQLLWKYTVGHKRRGPFFFSTFSYLLLHSPIFEEEKKTGSSFPPFLPYPAQCGVRGHLHQRCRSWLQKYAITFAEKLRKTCNRKGQRKWHLLPKTCNFPRLYISMYVFHSFIAEVFLQATAAVKASVSSIWVKSKICFTQRFDYE